MRPHGWLMTTLLIALCAFAGAQDIPSIVEDATSDDAGVRRAAVEAALALERGDLEELVDMLEVPGPDQDDTGVRFALHGVAVLMGAPGTDLDERDKVIRVFSAFVTSAAPAACRGFIVRQLHVMGGADTVPALAEALTNAELADDAAQALTANGTPEAAAALREALPDSEGNARLGIIAGLGDLRDKASVAALIELLDSADDGVAAARALASIGDARATDPLAALAAKAEGRAKRHVFASLIRLAETLTADGKRKPARDVYAKALDVSGGTVRAQAALIGLGKVGTAEDVPALLGYLVQDDQHLFDGAMQALINIPDEQAGAALAEATRTGNPDAREAVLVILSQRDEPAARRAIEAGLQSNDPTVRVRALELLDRLGEPEFRDTLLEAAKVGPDTRVYAVALAAYMAQANAIRDEGDRDEARAMYATSLDLAETSALRRTALDGLGSVAHADSLPLVKPFLSDGDVREVALRAYVNIGGALADAGKKDEAIALLQDALAMGPPRDVTNSAVSRLRDLGVNVDPAKAAGFVTHWWVIGPFPGNGVDIEFPPDTSVDLAASLKVEGRDLTWAEHHSTDANGIVNFAGMMNPNSNVTAYMYAEVTVDAAQDILVKSGSDDGMKLWLNGEEIFKFGEPRSLRVDEDTTEARLEAGANSILAKVSQGGGGWEACLRLTDRDGKPIEFTQKGE